MEKSKLQKKIESNGFIIISTAIALLYWYIDSLQLGPVATRVVTFLLFISYGASSQYFMNAIRRVLAEVISLSLTDELTGLYNRRGFNVLAVQHLRLAKRTDTHLLLLYADIDDLKSVNDQQGHDAGDELIRKVATIFKKTFRESDLVGRIGGDEFVVLAACALEKDSNILEERLRKHVDAFNEKESGPKRISISYGIVPVDPQHSHSIAQLLSEADTLMYEKKRGKKNNSPPASLLKPAGG